MWSKDFISVFKRKNTCTTPLDSSAHLEEHKNFQFSDIICQISVLVLQISYWGYPVHPERVRRVVSLSECFTPPSHLSFSSQRFSPPLLSSFEASNRDVLERRIRALAWSGTPCSWPLFPSSSVLLAQAPARAWTKSQCINIPTVCPAA